MIFRCHRGDAYSASTAPNSPQSNNFANGTPRRPSDRIIEIPLQIFVSIGCAFVNLTPLGGDALIRIAISVFFVFSRREGSL